MCAIKDCFCRRDSHIYCICNLQHAAVALDNLLNDSNDPSFQQLTDQVYTAIKLNLNSNLSYSKFCNIGKLHQSATF